jgi:hypothetical protein
MKTIILILAAIMAVGLLGGCTINNKEDTMETKNYEINDFTRIEVGGAFKVNIEQSDTFQVSVSADDLSRIRVEKTGDTLVIKRQGLEWFVPFQHRPIATVYLPALTGVNITGASEGTIKNFHSETDLAITVSGASHLRAENISAGKLDVKVTGASTVKGDIKAQGDAKFEALGASHIELTGAGTNAELAIIGASSAELGEFPVQNASLKVSGASHVMMNLNGKLDANVSGASHLYWSGNPTMGDIRASGVSSMGQK